MPTLAQMQFPPPKDWDEFEEICFSIFKEKWKDEYAQRNGKKGDAQNGVDFYGNNNLVLNGAQCKGKEIWPPKQLSIREIEKEIEKAKSFKPPLKRYIIATTASRNSKIQEYARTISEKLLQEGLFSVHVYSWEDITEELVNFPNLVRLHYPFPYQSSSDEIAQETKEDIKSEIKDGFLQIHKKLEPLYKGFNAANIESTLKDEIDFAKNLLEKGKPESTIDYLINLKNEKWHIATANDKFRIIANIAHSYLIMNDFDKASYYFIESYGYDKENTKAQINYVLGKSLANEYQSVEYILKDLISKNSDNIEVYILYILNTSDSLETIQQTVPAEMKDKASIFYSIGHILLKAEKIEDAILFLKEAVDKERSNDSLASLATAMLQMVLNPFIDKQKINLNETLDNIISLFNEALEKLSNSELIKYKFQWFLNRGTAKQLNRDFEGAKKDFEKTLEYKPKDLLAKRNLALWEFERGDRKKAIRLVKEIIDTDEMPEINLILADFLRIEKEYEESEIIITNYIENNADRKYLGNAKAILEAIYSEQGLIDKAKEVNIEREKDDPLSIVVTIDSAYIDKANGNEDLAKAKLIESIKDVTLTTTHLEKKRLANALYDFKLYSEAITVYESFINKYDFTAENKKLLNCYFETGKLSKGLQLCLILRKNDTKDKGLVELESYIYEDLGDNDKAIDTLKTYFLEYNDIEILIELATLYYKKRDYSNLGELLKTKIETNNLSLPDRIKLAQLYSLRDFRSEFLNLIYETRRKFYNESEAHSHYVWLFLERKDKDLDLLNLDSAENDTAIILSRGSEKKIYILENREDSDLSKGEINAGTPLYKKLIDHKINDKVNLSDNILAQDFWVIEDIKSKYIHALHESMSTFNRYFPEDNSLQQISVGDDIKETLNELFKYEDQRKQNVKLAEDLYKKAKMPLSAVAKYLSKNILEIYRYFTYEPKLGIMSGDMKYVNQLLNYNEIKNKLILDTIALNSIINIGMEDLIKSSFKKLYITQSVLDDVNQRIDEIGDYLSDGRFTIFKEEGQYYKNEITPEQIEYEKKYLQRMLEFITGTCKIISLEPSAIEDFTQYNKMKTILGKTSIDTLLLAKQMNGYLYTDDAALRSLCKQEFKIEGIWTQNLLSILKNELLTTKNMYNKFIIKLSLLNYKHTSINAANLIDAAKQSDWMPKYPFTKILETLSGGQSDELSASIVAADFIFELWKQIVSNEKRNAILDLLLSNLSKNRNTSRALDNFEVNLSIKLKLIPIWLDEILNLILFWRRSHIL